MSQWEAIALLSMVSMALPGQSGVQIAMRVVHDIELRVDHPTYGAPGLVSLPRDTVVPYQMRNNLQVQSGSCSVAMGLRSGLTLQGEPSASLAFDCVLPTLGTAQDATASSTGDLVFLLTSPQPTGGTLWLLFDTRNSYGPTTLGDLFVDVGDDGTIDAVAPGQSNCVRTFECGARIDGEGLRVRVLHTGASWGTPEAASEYHVSMSMVWLDGASPVRRGPSGCAPLDYSRWSAGPGGTLVFSFQAAQPAGTFFALAAGLPSLQPVSMVGMTCPLVCAPAVVQLLLDRSLASFPAPHLHGLGTAIVQGFVCRPDDLIATDSWIIG